jgi:putative membrane protein
MARWTEWQKQGQEPDYRFSLANERTFLAWIRTALAVLAGGILLHQFATKLEPRWVLLALSAGLAVMSAVIGAGAYLHWRDNEIAMRHARPLPFSLLVPLMSLAVLVMSVVATVLLLQ